MAYTHSKYEIMMTPITPATALGPTAAGAGGAALSVTTVVAQWSPGFVPHLIRGAAIIQSASDAPAANPVPVLIQADISTPGTPTGLFRLSLPTAGSPNKSHYYRPTYQIEIKPGMTVAARPTTAATAGVRANIVLYVEPRWEEPGNVTTMTGVTAIP